MDRRPNPFQAAAAIGSLLHAQGLSMCQMNEEVTKFLALAMLIVLAGIVIYVIYLCQRNKEPTDKPMKRCRCLCGECELVRIH